MLEEVYHNILRVFKHIKRMDEGYLTKRMYRVKADGAIEKGTPKRRRIEEVKKIIEQMGLGFQETKKVNLE